MELNQNTFRMPWAQCEPSGPLLRPADVIARTGLSRSLIYEMIAQGQFPPFIKIGSRASAMPESWLNAYVRAAAERALTREPRGAL